MIASEEFATSVKSLLKCSINNSSHNYLYCSPKINDVTHHILPKRNEVFGKNKFIMENRSFDDEICRVMNDFYYSHKVSKEEIAHLVNIIKGINNSNKGNTIFVTVFRNIQNYMKKIKISLHRRLNVRKDKSKGKMPSRRHSARCILTSSDLPRRDDEIAISEDKIQTKTMIESPKKYVEFLISLCKYYKRICEISEIGLESVCKLILSKCKPNTDSSNYDIHKSEFYNYILEDSLIMVLKLIILDNIR